MRSYSAVAERVATNNILSPAPDEHAHVDGVECVVLDGPTALHIVLPACKLSSVLCTTGSGKEQECTSPGPNGGAVVVQGQGQSTRGPRVAGKETGDSGERDGARGRCR